MSPVLEVLDGGLQTTIQDAGRPGLLALGVPRAGALDDLSFRLANRLAGNPRGTAVLELRSPAPVLRVQAASARIVLTGSGQGLAIERDGTVQNWASWRSIGVRQGDVIRIVPFADTAVAYLAVTGGFDVPVLFGSQATFLRGGFGGFEGRSLTTGDALPLNRDAKPDDPDLTLLHVPTFTASPVLRALPGPQAAHFADDVVAAFFRQEFTVSRDIDRMGMRLEGTPLRHKAGADIISDATVPGAIQVPGSSQPILLLKDCQTTGGYPKIAVVISADLSAAGRVLPGGKLHFRKVTMTEAEEALADAGHMYRSYAASAVAVRESWGA